jgi:hypothetical protein
MVSLHFFNLFSYRSNSLSLSFPFTEYAPLKPKKRENKEDMSDAIFLAKKKRTDHDEDDEDENEDVDGTQQKGRELLPQEEDFDPAL